MGRRDFTSCLVLAWLAWHGLAASGPAAAAPPAEKWWLSKDPCPAGTTLVGAPPPKGREVHCDNDAGERHGPATSFAEGGRPERQGSYVRGRMNGLWQIFDLKGKLSEEEGFRDGELDGPHLKYHDNGAKWLEGGYQNGRPHGLHVWRDAKGKELDRFEMKNGTGSYRSWHANGTLAEESPLLNAAQHGAVKRWHENGKIAGEGTFERGEMRRWTVYDEAGVKTLEHTRSGTQDNFSGERRYFLPTGEVDRVEVQRGYRTTSIVYWQEGRPLAVPTAEALRCSDEKVAKRAWAEAGSVDEDSAGCLHPSETFPGIAPVGSFAHDRGCMGAGYVVDCQFKKDITSQEVLARGGWARANASRREALALAYLREVALRFDGTILTDDPTRPKPKATSAGDQLTIVLWLQHPSGMRRGRGLSELRFVFAASGDVQSAQLKTFHEGDD